MVVEAVIRPIFQKPGPFMNLPNITAVNHAPNGSTVVTDVRPPKGVIWRIIIASLQAVSGTFAAGGTINIEIGLFDGTNFRMKQADQWLQGDGQVYVQVNTTYAPSGSEALITYDNYLRLRSIATASTSGSIDVNVIAEPV